MKKTFLLIALIFLAIFCGCMSQVTVLNSNGYSVPEADSLYSGEFYIKNVIDERGPDYYKLSSNIQLNETAADYVKTLYKNILDKKGPNQLNQPVDVYIEKLTILENFGKLNSYYLVSSLRFQVPHDGITDTIRGQMRHSFNQNMIDNLNYALNECLTSFIKNYKNIGKTEPGHKKDTANNSLSESTNDKVFIEKSVPELNSDPPVKGMGFGLGFYAGDNLTGVQINLRFNHMKDTYDYGYGAGFVIYNIKTNRFSGFLFGSDFPFNLKYYLNSGIVRFFIAGAVRFNAGSEKIENYKENGFFIGPTIDEYAGISINRNIFIEAGFFQLKFFGSSLLPEDTGYRVSINFSFQ